MVCARPILLVNRELGAPRYIGYWTPKYRHDERSPLGRCRRRSRPSSPPRSRLRCCRGLGFDHLRFLAGSPTTATEAKLFGQTGAPFRITGCGQWMVSGEFPATAILVDAQSMAGHEMPSEHLTAPAAFEANDIIGVDRSTDRDGGGPLRFGFGCRFSE